MLLPDLHTSMNVAIVPPRGSLRDNSRKYSDPRKVPFALMKGWNRPPGTDRGWLNACYLKSSKFFCCSVQPLCNVLYLSCGVRCGMHCARSHMRIQVVAQDLILTDKRRAGAWQRDEESLRTSCR